MLPRWESQGASALKSAKAPASDGGRWLEVERYLAQPLAIQGRTDAPDYAGQRMVLPMRSSSCWGLLTSRSETMPTSCWSRFNTARR